MTRDNHTPEPWYHGGKDWFNGVAGKIRGHVIKSSSEHESPQILGFFWYDCKDKVAKLEEVQLANAERTIACINACAGIADPSVVPELLEALEEIMVPFKGISDENLLLDWQRAARTVINKAKGGMS